MTIKVGDKVFIKYKKCRNCDICVTWTDSMGKYNEKEFIVTWKDSSPMRCGGIKFKVEPNGYYFSTCWIDTSYNLDLDNPDWRI